MTGVFFSALFIGALGSLHCIGMCGPLALSLPIPAASPFAKMMAALLYNAGRVLTYSVLGALVGLIGASFSLFGVQQWLSILSGSA
ncbi:MAG: sulfite exporter TauE/SafE family protein, partial [Chitinophagaceae bacterium]